MLITEIYYDQIDWTQFPYGLADWANEISLKADKGRSPEQREAFKQQVVESIEADRLMMAQDVGLFIVGVSANYVTPWGSPPITGQAFEEGAIDAILAASDADPFVVHALACETNKWALRQLLHQPGPFRPLAPGEQPRRLTLAEVQAVIAEKEAVLQATYVEYGSRDPFFPKMLSRQRRQRKHRHSSRRTSN